MKNIGFLEPYSLPSLRDMYHTFLRFPRNQFTLAFTGPSMKLKPSLRVGSNYGSALSSKVIGDNKNSRSQVQLFSQIFGKTSKIENKAIHDQKISKSPLKKIIKQKRTNSTITQPQRQIFSQIKRSIPKMQESEEGFKKIESQIIKNFDDLHISFQNPSNFVEKWSDPQGMKINVIPPDKKVKIEQKQEVIDNPYAKIQINNRPPSQLKSSQQQIVPKVQNIPKLTDQQVCQIISSRKKAIIGSRLRIPKEGRQEGQKDDIRGLMSMSDFDINAMLKIEDQDLKIEPPVQQIPVPQTLNPELKESFVPYYKLHPSPRNDPTTPPQLLPQHQHSFIFIPSNINTTKPTESHVYENRRISEASDQPSSLVFELSANSNF